MMPSGPTGFCTSAPPVLDQMKGAVDSGPMTSTPLKKPLARPSQKLAKLKSELAFEGGIPGLHPAHVYKTCTRIDLESIRIR